MRHLLNVVRGFLMGSADVVPGVSGGTVALVLGIYERLVAAIRSGAAALGSAARGRWAGFRGHLEAVDWGFLIPLLAGIILAIFSLAALIERMLEDEPQNTAALFFGPRGRRYCHRLEAGRRVVNPAARRLRGGCGTGVRPGRPPVRRRS